MNGFKNRRHHSAVDLMNRDLTALSEQSAAARAAGDVARTLVLAAACRSLHLLIEDERAKRWREQRQLET